MREVDGASAFVFADQQQRDQVTGDDEEHFDPEKPALQPRMIGVIEHHRNDSDGTQTIEARQIRKTTQPSRGRAITESRSRLKGVTLRHRTTSMERAGLLFQVGTTDGIEDEVRVELLGLIGAQVIAVA